MILLTGRGSFSTEFINAIPCDIISFQKLSITAIEEIVSKYDVIIHNAANISSAGFIQAVEDNFTLTKRIIDSIEKVNPTARFIYLSSMSMLKNELEYQEIEKMSIYGFSKYLGEIYCLKHPLKNVACFRFSTIFYSDPLKDGLSKLIFDAVNNKEIVLFNNGEAKRDFIPLTIIVQYLQQFIKANYLGHHTYTLGAGIAHSFSQIAHALKKGIPSLVIKNADITPAAEVLHQFSVAGLKTLSKINFSIEDHINNYLKQLQPNENSNF